MLIPDHCRRRIYNVRRRYWCKPKGDVEVQTAEDDAERPPLDSEGDIDMHISEQSGDGVPRCETPCEESSVVPIESKRASEDDRPDFADYLDRLIPIRGMGMEDTDDELKAEGESDDDAINPDSESDDDARKSVIQVIRCLHATVIRNYVEENIP